MSGRNSPTSRETDEAGEERSRSISGLARTTRIPVLSPERRIAARILPAPAGQRDRGNGLNCPLSLRDERVRGGDVLAEVERTIGRKIEPALCGVERTSKAADEAVFEAHRNENSVAQRG